MTYREAYDRYLWNSSRENLRVLMQLSKEEREARAEAAELKAAA